jgi:pyruvate/2-oxoglutarate dehydrogenase complex dihydrolipoamide dehydrogenase (E3) component
MVEALVLRGIKVTLVEAQPQLLPQLDAEMTVPLFDEMRAKGVQIQIGSFVQTLRPSSNPAVGPVEVQSSKQSGWMTADFVILSGP